MISELFLLCAESMHIITETRENLCVTLVKSRPKAQLRHCYMPIHKFQFSRQVGNNLPTRLHLSSKCFFFPSIFWFPNFGKKFFQNISKIISTYTKRNKFQFFTQKITKWRKSARKSNWAFDNLLISENCLKLVSFSVGRFYFFGTKGQWVRAWHMHTFG